MFANVKKGSCLVQFWHSKYNKKMSCPLCRADMNILISRAHEDSKIKNKIDEYNKLFSNKPENVLLFMMNFLLKFCQ